MKSMPSASRICASTMCPMRHFAITGIETPASISLIKAGSDMRATPPSRRMRAGMRSSAITAAAPDTGRWAGLLRDARPIGAHHVHDHAAFQHLRQTHLEAELFLVHGASPLSLDCVLPTLQAFERRVVFDRQGSAGE